MASPSPSHFYVTLISNALGDIYEQNTHAEFTVELAQTVDLVSTSNWEVGVSEIPCSPHHRDVGTTALIYCDLFHRPQHTDISLPLIIIIIISARVSKRVP